MSNKILIFDGECPYCKMASETVEKLNDDVMVIDWKNEASQSFLEAQFDSTPFSMVFVDSETDEIWVGDEAADKVASESKVTNPVSSVVSDNYDSISSMVGFLSGREQDVDKEYYGIYEIRESAEEELEELYQATD